MKKSLIRLSLVIICTLALFVNCTKEEYNEEMLYGRWYCDNVNGLKLYYTYNNDHTGRYADKDDYGKNFTWSLDGDVLEMKILGDGVNVTAYEVFIITSLSDNEFRCYDEGDSSSKYTFTRK